MSSSFLEIGSFWQLLWGYLQRLAMTSAFGAWQTKKSYLPTRHFPKGCCLFPIHEVVSLIENPNNRDMANVLNHFSGCSPPIPGQIKPPLFDFIDFVHLIIDPLHNFLRISDKLLDLLFDEALSSKGDICSNCHTKGKKRKCADPCSCSCHISVQDIILDQIKNKIGVSHFEFYEGKTGEMEWTSLQGDDKMAILKKLDLGAFLTPERSVIIRSLWDDFLKLNHSLHASLQELCRKSAPQDPVITLDDFPQ